MLSLPDFAAVHRRPTGADGAVSPLRTDPAGTGEFATALAGLGMPTRHADGDALPRDGNTLPPADAAAPASPVDVQLPAVAPPGTESTGPHDPAALAAISGNTATSVPADAEVLAVPEMAPLPDAAELDGRNMRDTSRETESVVSPPVDARSLAAAPATAVQPLSTNTALQAGASPGPAEPSLPASADRPSPAAADAVKSARVNSMPGITDEPQTPDKLQALPEVTIDGRETVLRATTPGPLLVPLSGLAPNVANASGTAPPAVLPPPVDIPVGEPRWGEAIAGRVVLIAGQRLSSAEIRLNPAELGPVTVDLKIEDNIAQVTFNAQQQLTRDALEQALPRLREMLAEQGLSLGRADVTGQDTAGRSGGHATDDDAAVRQAGNGPGGDVVPSAGVAAERAIEGLIDTFA